jgi:curved DNA-binding protein
MNHYEVLGVAKNATTDEIKKAYRKLASQHHPDKGGDTAKFQQIQSAYDILSDTHKRHEYDNPSQHRFHEFNQGADLNDFFKNFGFHFGDNFQQHRRHNQSSRRNKDLRITIQVDLKSTLNEQEKTVSVKTTRGDRETVSVIIPKGITAGSTIKYAGLGDNFFESLPRGDLYVNISVDVPVDVELYETEIYQRLKLNVLDAMIGKTLEVTTPFGETFELTVPPGIQQGNKLRIRDKGLALSSGRGNLFLVVDLVVPKQLSEQQIKLLSQIRDDL